MLGLRVAQAYATAFNLVTKKTEIAARSLRSMWKFPIFWLYCFTAQMFVNWPLSFYVLVLGATARSAVNYLKDAIHRKTDVVRQVPCRSIEESDARVSDRAKGVLFSPQHQKWIDDIANLGEQLKGGDQFVNTSNFARSAFPLRCWPSRSRRRRHSG